LEGCQELCRSGGLDEFINDLKEDVIRKKSADTAVPQMGPTTEERGFASEMGEEQFWKGAKSYVDVLKNLLFEEDKEEGKERSLWLTWLTYIGFSYVIYKTLRLVVGAAVGALFGMIKEVLRFFKIFPKKDKRKRFVPRILNKEVTAAGQSNVNVRGICAAPNHPTTFVVRDPSMVAQAGGVKTMNNVVANGWRMFTHYQGVDSNYGQMTYLTSNLAMMPYHFYIEMRSQYIRDAHDPAKVAVKLVNNLLPSNVFEMTLADFLAQPMHVIEKEDICFIAMRSTYAPRTVIQNFMKQEDLRHISGKRVRLDVNEFQTPEHSKFPLMRADHADCYWYKDPVRYNDVDLDRAIAYDFPVMSGDCGSILSLVDPNHFSGRFAMGFHIATPTDFDRRGRVGVSTIVTQEKILDACKALGIVLDRFKETMVAQGIQCTDEYDFFLPEVGSFTPICGIDKSYPLPLKSKLYPTSYNGIIGEHKLRPAVLSPVFRNGEIVYPMANAVKPYSSPLLSLSKDKMKQALHIAMRPFSEWSKHKPRSIFTFEEAVLGVPSMKFRSIPRGTSAGFPHVFHVRKGKVEFFGDEQHYNLDTAAAKELKVDVAKIVDHAKQGERMGHVFLDFLKDELRKPEKIEAVATRLISSSPLNLTVATRQYCGTFCAAVMESPASCGLAPGINVYTDWNGLSNYLQRKGSRVFAGDVKALDASEQVDLLKLIVDFISDWYNDGEENRRVREVLLMEMYHSRHLGGNGREQNHIYQWNKGMPSGHPLTTIVNSIYTLAGIVACYIEATGDRTGFWEHVNAVTYGDDNLCNIDDVTSEVFNQVTVAKHMKNLLGIIFTSDRKDGELFPFTDLSQVTFLKRSFVRDRDYIYNAALELDSFLFTFYWCRNKKDEDQIISDVLETSLAELSLHEDSVWDFWAPKVIKIIYQRGGVLTTRCSPTRIAYRDMVRERGDSWY